MPEKKPSERLETFTGYGMDINGFMLEVMEILDELWEDKHKQYYPPNWYEENASKGVTGPC